MKKRNQIGAVGRIEPSARIQLLCEKLRKDPVVFSRIASAVELPIGNLEWTRGLAGYEKARLSAVEALLRMQAETKAMQAGSDSEDTILDNALYKVGAGIIDGDHPEILHAFAHAQSIRAGADFIKSLAAKVVNAEKRVPLSYQGVRLDGTYACDINPFRACLAKWWLSAGFWLMPDRLIASVLSSLEIKARPNCDQVVCNRQTVTRAIKEMGLTKPAGIGIERIGEKSVLIFKSGYQPQWQ
jgi:hypothetical protein